MADWQFTEAGARLDEVVDRTESEGLQSVWRNGREFVVVTEEQLKARTQPTKLARAPRAEGAGYPSLGRSPR